MSDLAPLDALYDAVQGNDLPLAPELARLYGRLHFPMSPGQPYVVGNFVTTMDGVVSLNLPGQSGGGEISGFNTHDRMVMGLLRGRRCGDRGCGNTPSSARASGRSNCAAYHLWGSDGGGLWIAVRSYVISAYNEKPDVCCVLCRRYSHSKIRDTRCRYAWRLIVEAGLHS
jgi:hypothetical protein